MKLEQRRPSKTCFKPWAFYRWHIYITAVQQGGGDCVAGDTAKDRKTRMAGHLRKFAEEEDCATKRDGLKEKLEAWEVKSLGENVGQILNERLCLRL